jgi:ABC-2 type transport system ATP-binding protein
MVARLGMDPDRVRRQPFVKLSGGQKQKLLIGIALGRKADLLVMDEPAANLDPQARRELFAVLAERAADSVMLISSHRLDEVAALVNRVVELDQGAVVLDDRVLDAVALAGVLSCRLSLGRVDPALAGSLGEWGFRPEHGGTVWTGQVASPDRLRFLGLLSRHAGSLAGITMAVENQKESAERAHASQVA